MESMDAKGTIIIVSNSLKDLVHYRLGIIENIIKSGSNIHIIAPKSNFNHRIQKLGCTLQHFKLYNHSINPIREIFSLIQLLFCFYKIKPAVVLSFTIKPNIYSALACRILNIPIITTITGLGITFTYRNWKTQLVKFLYRIALRKSYTVFFQNKDDMAFFLKLKLVSKKQAVRVPGSGVDLNKFNPNYKKTHASTKPAYKQFTFLMISRIIKSKGIYEYIEAAYILKKKYPQVRFQLLGPYAQTHLPFLKDKRLIETATRQNVLEYMGETVDVRPYIAAADAIVHPSSYREGIPRVLLEAAAMGKPIITTNAPGCREVVKDGFNGFLCKLKDSNDLVNVMLKLEKLSRHEREIMGKNGYYKVKEKFNQQLVLLKYQNQINKIFTCLLPSKRVKLIS